MPNAEDIIGALTGRPTEITRSARVSAPSNIALAKYWGKRDAALNLPMNSSLSVSLGDWGTTTRIDASEEDTLVFNGERLAPDAPAAAQIWRFVSQFCGPGRATLQIETTNTIPTAAGLASSASGFAALTQALDAAFGTKLPPHDLSQIARFGSGSASRSIWHGFVRWDKGTAADGKDSHARLIESPWPAFRIAMVPVDTGPKAQSSRAGMTHTVQTSPLYTVWPQQAEADCNTVETAVIAQDFHALGTIAEANALAMHATMMAARPALTYLKTGSWKVLERLWAAREEGLEAFATMDAGANVKLLFLEEEEPDVLRLFPTAKVVAPFSATAR